MNPPPHCGGGGREREEATENVARYKHYSLRWGGGGGRELSPIYNTHRRTSDLALGEGSLSGWGEGRCPRHTPPLIIYPDIQHPNVEYILQLPSHL
jgi:hypothetical protein